MTRAEGFAQGKRDADAFFKSIYAPMLTKSISRALSANKGHIEQLEAQNRQHEKNLRNVDSL